MIATLVYVLEEQQMWESKLQREHMFAEIMWECVKWHACVAGKTIAFSMLKSCTDSSNSCACTRRLHSCLKCACMHTQEKDLAEMRMSCAVASNARAYPHAGCKIASCMHTQAKDIMAEMLKSRLEASELRKTTAVQSYFQVCDLPPLPRIVFQVMTILV